jgi:multidrug efflux system outer membrane protein
MALIALPLLSGCTLIPRYERPGAPVAAQFPGTETGGEAHPAEIGWKDFIGDPQLRDLVALALINNRDLRVAILNVDKAKAQYRVERAALAPTVDANGSFTRSRSSGVTSSQWAVSGSVSWELDLFGRVRSLKEQALEQYLATEEAQRAAQVSVVAQVATEYFAWREAEQQRELAQQTLGSVKETFSVMKASFDAGAVNELDLRTSEGQVESARINLTVAERQIGTARDALVLLIGEEIPEKLAPAASFDEAAILATIPAGLPSQMIEQRPDIREAEHTLKAANANIGAARAAFFPTITLTGALGGASTELSSLFGSAGSAWAFAPQISVPLFSGGKNAANLTIAEVEKRIEVAHYEKAIQTAFREVADALVGAETYARQVREGMALVETQSRRFELAQVRFSSGEDSYLNVLSAQRDLYSAQRDVLDARYNELASRVSLYKSLGGGWK